MKSFASFEINCIFFSVNVGTSKNKTLSYSKLIFEQVCFFYFQLLEVNRTIICKESFHIAKYLIFDCISLQMIKDLKEKPNNIYRIYFPSTLLNNILNSENSGDAEIYNF